jgi:ABC-2 type transport system permease protein
MPIFDQGYQHWSGTLRGPMSRRAAIALQGVRAAMGNKYLRLAMIMAWLPAILLAAALCIWGLIEQKSALVRDLANFLPFLPSTVITDPKTYRVEVWTLCYAYFMGVEQWLSMMLVLIVGPNLISQDLRYNAFPLYFSRPLRRIDYVLGKLGVIVVFLGAVTILPAIIAYVLGLLFSLDLSIIGDTLPVLLGAIAYGLIIAVSAGTLMLSLSSLSRNSRYVSMFWLAIWVGLSSVSGVLVGIDMGPRQGEAWRNGSMNDGSYMDRELELAKTNWRPLVSYTANLTRVGDELLGTADAWTKYADLLPGGAGRALRGQNLTRMYPWTWSAAVLLGFFGLSAWILNRSIKSLDRLK